MIVPLDLDPGYFYNFHPEHLIVTRFVPAGSELEYHKWSVHSMFNIHTAYIVDEEVEVGYMFTSNFHIENTGAYLMTRMKNGVKAKDYTVLAKSEHLIIYNYGNSGALAVSPKISSYIQTFFEDQ